MLCFGFNCSNLQVLTSDLGLHVFCGVGAIQVFATFGVFGLVS